jgi:hypothetical protein
MPYSKNGSIPKDQTDGTEGWIEVPSKPVAPEGKEAVWWYPPGWVVRDLKPADREGYQWNWSQSEEKWVENQIQIEGQPTVEITEPTITITTSNVSAPVYVFNGE